MAWLTLQGAVAGDLVWHELALLVAAVDLGDLLAALFGLGAREGRDGLLAADLALGRLVVAQLRQRGRRRASGLGLGLGPVVAVGLGGRVCRAGSGGVLRGGGVVERGGVISVRAPNDPPAVLLAVLNDLVGALGHVLLRVHLLQHQLLALAAARPSGAPCSVSLALRLRPRPKVTVVDGLEVFGHRVLVVAVHPYFLFRTMGVVAILRRKKRGKREGGKGGKGEKRAKLALGEYHQRLIHG